MTKRAKRILLTIGGVLVIFVIAIVGLAWHVLNSFDKAFAEPYPHRPDVEMIRNFSQHRDEFEYVRTLAMADENLRRVDEDWSDPRNLNTEKATEYRRLFKVIGTPRGISKYGGSGRIEFLASSMGWVASGSTKGYLYVEGKPPEGNRVDSLDDVSILRDLDVDYLKPIEGKWYLYFRR